MATTVATALLGAVLLTGTALAASPSPGPTSSYPPAQCSSPTVFVSSTAVTPGETITISGCGYTPGQTVTITLHSAPIILASVVVGTNGRFSTQVTIPLNTSYGNHYLEASGTTGQTASIAVVVKPAPAVSHPSSSSGLPFTGADIAGLVLAGLVLVGGGSLLVVSARRRRTASAV
ncbi:MAG: hypothetical protein ACYDAQ_01585 [Mycobacteriales bacterium]